jgi:hypothetical protein
MDRIKELQELIVELKEEKKRWYSRVYRINNKEHCSNYNKNYKQKPKYKAYKKNKDKEYENTPKGKAVRDKAKKKYLWKSKGVNIDNFEEIYKRYLETTNCDNCNVLLTKDRYNTITTKCLDHSHTTGEFRNILCNLCNMRRRENNM